MNTKENINRAREILAYYTLGASATGAIPVPAASVAVVAQNGAMLSHIAAALEHNITFADIVTSLGVAGSLNVVGRNLFIEGAKLLSWGTGSIWAAALLSALGATTAGVQTFIIGSIAIEVGKNGGVPLASEETGKIVDECKDNYNGFIKEWSSKPPQKPE